MTLKDEVVVQQGENQGKGGAVYTSQHMLIRLMATVAYI
jgi:ribosomal protein L24